MRKIKRLFVCLMMISAFSVDALARIKPPPLRKGDTIGIIAPASCPEEDQKAISAGVSRLANKGYKVKLAQNLMTRHGYLAGTDYDRAKALMEMWKDPKVKAIWCYRGGFGCTRILDRIDYSLIKKNPKILIGMSDLTALHAAINKETGLVTFLGPNWNHVFVLNSSRGLPYNEAELWNVVAPSTSYLYKKPKNFPQKGHKIKTIRKGKATGRLTGGNLALIVSLIGTPWEIETKGRILVIEEVNEEPFRIDRMFRQLKQAGHLDKVAGVILCSWKGCLGKTPHKSLSLETIFDDYFGRAPYPVLLGFPSGHIPEQATLPLNVLAELDATKHTLRLLESPVQE